MIISDKTKTHSFFMDIESMFVKNSVEIEAWFRQKWQQHSAPFYSSIDIRNSGFKLAPIDTNLFPGGFNNINIDDGTYIVALQIALEKICPNAKSLALIPENHTRNKNYLQNVASLNSMLQQAGFEVLLGSLRSDIEAEEQILIGDECLTFFPIKNNNNKIEINGKTPCAILLNNDLSAGMPTILENTKQDIMPHPSLGWFNRCKSNHYAKYQTVVQEFCSMLDIDPWLLSTLFASEKNVDLSNNNNSKATILLDKITKLFTDIENKYKQFNIKEQPFVIVKADSGTYGMGIVSLTEPEQIVKLNRKQRKKMSTIKEGLLVDKILMQEGVPTIEMWQQPTNVAEPVLYLIDRFVVGGFYRFHSEKNAQESLNSPGMDIAPLSFDIPCCQPDWHLKLNDSHNRLYIYSIVARLAALASSLEFTN